MAAATPNTQSLPQASLYIGDLHPLATEAMLYSKFAEIGPVLSTRVCRDLATRTSLGYGYVNFEDPKDEFGEIKSCCVEKDHEGKSKGFGFVCFSNPENAEQAVKVMHGKDLGGRPLYAGRAQRREERQEELKQRLEKMRAERQSKYVPGVNLYVKNLDDTIDDERLKEAFGHYGPITSAKVMTDPSGRSKGFGFVCFTQPEQAARAVTEMNATLLGSKPLYVAIAQRKEDRRAKLIAEHQQRMAQYRSAMPPMLPTAAAHAAAPSYFPTPAFPPAQRFYPPNAVISSQPRWNRPGGMPAQLGAGVPARQPIPGHYLSAPNPAAGMTASQMAAMAQMRTPAGVGRAMLPSGMPALSTGPHMSGSAMMNAAAAQRQPGGRPAVPLQQVMATAGGLPQRPSVASVVAAPANVNPNAVPQVPRGMMHPVMGPTGNVRFNQTARNVSAQPASGMPSVLAPLGDQGPLTISALAQVPEDDQKRMLGERLYPLVRDVYPQMAQKLTGMLLGVDNADVIHMLESKEYLLSKLEEAINVLKNSRNMPPEHSEEVHTAPVDSLGMNSPHPGQNGDGSNSIADPTKADVKGQVISGDTVKADA